MMRQAVEETVDIYYCKMNITVDMMQTEYWNSDDSQSKFYYQPWDLNNLKEI